MLDDNNFDINRENEQVQKETVSEPVSPYAIIPEEYHEKRKIRYMAAAVGIPAISLSAIGYFWGYAYLFITTKFLGMTKDNALELLQNQGMQQFLQILLSCLMFLVPFSIAAKCIGVSIDDTIKFGKAKKGTFLPFVLFGVGFCAFTNIAMSYSSAFFDTFIKQEYNTPRTSTPSGIYGFILSFIATAIVPALVEEFACRGIILGLLRKFGDGFAIITSAIIFGVMHGNFDQIPFATVVGLILGYIYVKTESIWPCMLVHGINNAISVLLTYSVGIISVETQNAVYIMYLVIAMLLAIFAVLLFSKKCDGNYSLERKSSILSEKQKYIAFFTSWLIIIFLISNLYEAVSYFGFWEK